MKMELNKRILEISDIEYMVEVVDKTTNLDNREDEQIESDRKKLSEEILQDALLNRHHDRINYIVAEA